MSCQVAQHYWIDVNTALLFPCFSTLCSSCASSLPLRHVHPYLLLLCSPLPPSLPLHAYSTLTAPYLPPSLITACSPLGVPADDRAETDAECSVTVWQTRTHLVFYLSVPIYPLSWSFSTRELCFLASIWQTVTFCRVVVFCVKRFQDGISFRGKKCHH